MVYGLYLCPIFTNKRDVKNPKNAVLVRVPTDGPVGDDLPRLIFLIGRVVRVQIVDAVILVRIALCRLFTRWCHVVSN